MKQINIFYLNKFPIHFIFLFAIIIFFSVETFMNNINKDCKSFLRIKLNSVKSFFYFCSVFLNRCVIFIDSYIHAHLTLIAYNYTEIFPLNSGERQSNGFFFSNSTFYCFLCWICGMYVYENGLHITQRLIKIRLFSVQQKMEIKSNSKHMHKHLKCIFEMFVERLMVNEMEVV